MSDFFIEQTNDNNKKDNTKYTSRVAIPLYKPCNKKPDIYELVDKKKVRYLIDKIKNSNLPKHEKDFLILASYRHLVFNYSKIADYYAHAEKETQEIME